MRIAVYGLGRLGYPLFNVLGRAGYDVVGIDPKVYDLPQGPWPIKEPGLVWHDRFWVSALPRESDTSFIVVPTPSLDSGDHRGGFDSIHVEAALRQIDKVNEGSHVAVIVSTVSPGTCDRLAEMFPNLSIVYNPTFIALGDVVEGLVEPDLLLLGGSDGPALERVAWIWETVLDRFRSVWPYRHVASYAEIELIKLAVNAALGTKISLANSLGELFSAWGVSPSAVEVVGRDSRIGTAYFTPGSPITGPCLPRDNQALQMAATEKGVNLPISVATDRVNRLLLDGILGKVLDLNPTSVGILGMSYKYGIDVDTAAPGPWLAKRLKNRGIHTFTYDELLPGDKVEDVLVCDVIVVTQSEYRQLVEDFSGEVVVDLWPT